MAAGGWAEMRRRLMSVLDANLVWLGIWTLLPHVGFGGRRFHQKTYKRLIPFIFPLLTRCRETGGGAEHSRQQVPGIAEGSFPALVHLVGGWVTCLTGGRLQNTEAPHCSQPRLHPSSHSESGSETHSRAGECASARGMSSLGHQDPWMESCGWSPLHNQLQ